MKYFICTREEPSKAHGVTTLDHWFHGLLLGTIQISQFRFKVEIVGYGREQRVVKE